MMKLPFACLHQLADGLWVIEEMGSNIYIIKGEEKVLVLDTAYGLTDLKAVVRELCGDMPVICVNSHEHPDHNAGNLQFESVMVGRYGEPQSHTKTTDSSKQSLRNFLGKKLEGYPFDYEAWNIGPSEHVDPLFDGDVIRLGGIDLTVIETPGHSAGAIALYEPEKRWLFTGDTVLEWEVWGQLSSSLALRCYLDSLKKLAAYSDKVDWVLPAHSLEHRFMLNPEILTVYAEGTEKIVKGIDTGRPYEEKNPSFAGCRYALFSIGGMAYDPKRI